MKGLGVILIVLGGAGLVYGLRMDTTVNVPGQSLHLGEFSTYVPAQQVHNIGLMDQRRNVLIVSGLVLLGGFIFTGMATMAAQSQPAKTIAPDEPERPENPPSAPEAEDEDGPSSGTILLVACVGLGAFLLASWVFTRM